MEKLRRTSDDAGLTLIELIVAIVVSGIVLAAVTMILANSWRTQRNVLSVTEATNRGQVVSSAIERAMRNSLDFRFTTGTDVVSTNGGDALWVRTSLPGSLRCQGFRLGSGDAQMTTSNAVLPSSAGWPAWQSGIAKQGSAQYFARTVNGSMIYTFKINTEASPVHFSGDIAKRSQDPGSAACW